MEQTIKLKNPVSVIYEGRISWETIRVEKVHVLRSGRISHVIDDKGNKYDFEYIDNKESIYRSVIRNLMFNELI
jgi:hypothetical protein